MQPEQLQGTYLDLTTPHVADACMRLGIPVRCAPAGTRPLWSGTHLVGRVCPARHYGSVDVFLEAIEGSDPGDVLVVDNSGRPDEACVGDLVALEASGAGLVGIVIWGLHRDTTELQIIRLPVFSLGALPTGPQRLEPQDALALSSASCGHHIVTVNDFVMEMTTVSCLCRWIAPATLRIWQPTSVTRSARKRRECSSAPASGARPASPSTSRPDNLAET
jgi:regulator of RNase E activity RraA